EIKIAEKRYREADKLYGQAEDVLDDILANQHSFEENTAHAGTMSSIYLEHFRLAQRMGNVDRAFQVIERVRGRFVASQLFLREQSGARSPIITKLQSEIAATQLQLMRSGSSNSKSSYMEQLLSDERQLAFQLNEAGLRRRETLVKPTPLKAVQAELTNDEVFVEYVLDQSDAFCLVATNKSTKLFKLQADSTTIRSLTRSYLSELKAIRSGKRIATQLYQVLLAPVVSS